jgi:hypothetical protein
MRKIDIQKNTDDTQKTKINLKKTNKGLFNKIKLIFIGYGGADILTGLWVSSS